MSIATRSRTPRSVLVAVGVAALAPFASADIIGLPIPGWQVNRWDAASASPVDPPSSITLTTNTSGQSRSMLHVTKQSVAKFQTSFTYRFTGTSSSILGSAFNGFAGSTHVNSGTTLAIHDFLSLVPFSGAVALLVLVRLVGKLQTDVAHNFRSMNCDARRKCLLKPPPETSRAAPSDARSKHRCCD